MINRKIVWLSTLIFTIILAGCSKSADDVEITENQITHAYGHNIHKLTGIAHEGDAYELKIDDESAATATLEFNPVTVISGEPVNSTQKVEIFVGKLISAKTSFGEILDEEFNSLYSNYLNNSYILQNENM